MDLKIYNMKKIGILGSGNVAKVLATGFIKNGYAVKLGTRDTSKLADWLKENPTATVGSFAEAANFGDIIVLAVKGGVAKQVVESIDAAALKGKTIIDTTNPIADAPPENGVLKYFTDANKSLLEILQDTAKEANFVKAFNSVGSAFMVDPDFGGIKPTMFICGNNNDAKAEVKTILEQFNWETEDMGQAISARPIEALCTLWCIRGFATNQWSHAFKLLKK